MRLIVVLSLICLITGCSGPTLRARTFYTSRKDLASMIVDTPDPEKSTKRLGQVVWVQWNVPSVEEPSLLDVAMHFKDGSDRLSQYPITDAEGTLSLEITPEELQSTGGLLSYRILFYQKGAVIASTQHKLWVEKIEVKD